MSLINLLIAITSRVATLYNVLSREVITAGSLVAYLNSCYIAICTLIITTWILTASNTGTTLADDFTLFRVL